MEIQKRIIILFTNATIIVYKKLTSGIVPIVGGLEKNKGNVIRVDGCTAISGFKGRFDGRFLLNLSIPTALKLHNTLTGNVEDKLTDDVLFTVSKIGNMIARNAVTRINDEFNSANVRLSPPSVFAGKDMEFFNFKINNFNIILNTQHDFIRINIAVKNGEQ